MMNWHRLSITEVCDLLGTNPQGLSSINAEEKLHQIGPNELRDGKKKSKRGMLLAQFKDVMILVLLGAAIISGIIGDLTDTIERLQAYQEAGADVLFAPGVTELDELRTLVAAVDRPVNALPFPGSPPVAELAEIGVKRISIGSAFFAVGVAALATAATELLEQGTYGFWSQVPAGMNVARAAFTA